MLALTLPPLVPPGSVTHILPADPASGATDSSSDTSTFLANRQLLLAMDGPTCLGFVDFSFKSDDTPQNAATTVGSIRYLWYSLGQRAVGQALLDAAESSLKEAGATHCEAFQTPSVARKTRKTPLLRPKLRGNAPLCVPKASALCLCRPSAKTALTTRFL